MKNDDIREVENKTMSGCEQGCDCSKPTNKKKTKMIVFLLILALAGSILGYKLLNANKTDANNINSNSSESQDSDLYLDKINSQEVVNSRAQKNIGQSLSSFSLLNDLAVNQDAVFVFIPNKDEKHVDSTTVDAVSIAEQVLKANGIQVGLYTLQTDSPEYTSIASQASLPGILVVKKGGGMAMVSGDVTESKLVQAYVSCSRSGGCGTSSSCEPSKCQ
ncbi:hypothetical protein ACFL4A_03300 [bacterium]